MLMEVGIYQTSTYLRCVFGGRGRVLGASMVSLKRSRGFRGKPPICENRYAMDKCCKKKMIPRSIMAVVCEFGGARTGVFMQHAKLDAFVCWGFPT